jgi:hypothetical protein
MTRLDPIYVVHGVDRLSTKQHGGGLNGMEKRTLGKGDVKVYTRLCLVFAWLD